MTTRQLPKGLIGAKAERFLQIDARAAVDAEARTVQLAFASETPVERYWGNEILDLSPGSMRQDRLNSGAALLMDHNTRDQVGVIESVGIGADHVARAVVRFGKSARASEVFQDVADGIRRNVSVGYQIHAAKLESTSEEDGDTYRVTDWEPLEVSLVSVPADPNVGVGRSAPPPHEDNPMPEVIPAAPAATPTPAAPAPDLAQVRAVAEGDAVKRERQRVADINANAATLAQFPGVRELAVKAIAEGMTVDQFRAAALDATATHPHPRELVQIGMSDKEVKQYSFLRALNALANPTDMRAREAAAFEFEASGAAASKQRREVRGLVVPYDVLHRSIADGLQIRASDVLVGTASKGGNLVATELLTANFIDLLRNAMVINRLGAQYLSGLVGNIAIPKQTGGASFYWVAEDGSATASGQTVGQVTMTPHSGCAKTQISRKLLLQSSIDVEAFVRADIAKTVGLGIQAAAINGSGASNQPTGILNTGSIGSVVGGTNGAKPDWSSIVGLETAVSVANADVGTLGYLTNAAVRGYLKSVQKFTTNPGGDAVWSGGNTPLNGYQAAVTNAVPGNGTKGTGTDLSAIIFGNFADLIIGMWGGLELQVDPFSSGDTGAVIVRAFQDVDVAVRHPESFAAMTDAATA